MAARKSCTHLTWGEAKAKSGLVNPSTKKKPIPKNISHGDALTAKIISKNGASQQDLNQQRSLVRRAKREEERASQASVKRDEERERERAQQLVRPFEQALCRMREIMFELVTASPAPEGTCDEHVESVPGMKKCAECKQIQFDEVMALEAIFVDTGDFSVPRSSNLEKLRDLVEAYQMDEDNEELLRSIVGHQPLSVYLSQTVNDVNNPELEALLLLHITHPQLYPMGGATPHFEIVYFMVTDRTVSCSPDKPLESLAFLEESKFLEEILNETLQILPDPSIYETAVTWLQENLFKFVTIHPHASLL